LSVAKDPDDALTESSLLLVSDPIIAGVQKAVALTNKKDLLFIKELLEAGKVVPVIDRTYPLSGVPEAIRYLEAGHAQGKVVIMVDQNDNISL
jgi:NADPH:quinone reductase-like Zn-dependent oxidoreductase